MPMPDDILPSASSSVQPSTQADVPPSAVAIDPKATATPRLVEYQAQLREVVSYPRGDDDGE
jgi:hypothetical protein